MGKNIVELATLKPFRTLISTGSVKKAFSQLGESTGVVPRVAKPGAVPTPPKPDLELKEAEKGKTPIEAAERIKRESKRRGRKSTILTGPLGLKEPAETSKRVLLGR